jgi:hypothetical protein
LFEKLQNPRKMYDESQTVVLNEYTACSIIPSGLSEVCSSESNPPTGDENASVKGVIMELVYPTVAAASGFM